MLQETGAEDHERLLDALAQALAHAPALVDALLVVLLEQALIGVVGALGQARAVAQAPEHDELAVEVLLEDGLEVELHKGRPGEPGGIAQQPELQAVGDNPPQRIGAVEVFLDQGVGAAPAILAAGIEFLIGGDDVHRRGFGVIARPVRDGVGVAIHHRGARLIGQLVTENLQKRDGPGLARECGQAFAAALAAALEAFPMQVGVGKRILDLIAEARAVDTEIGGFLPSIDADLLTRKFTECLAADSIGAVEPAVVP